MDIQSKHTTNRCNFIYALCSMSLYSWYNYSLYDPINNSFFTPYYHTGTLFLLYLMWDTYHMMISKHILFRTDLLIHHALSFTITAMSLNNNVLLTSHYIIIECISLMNDILKNKPRLLKLYRTFCVCVIRTPLSLWFWYDYIPTIMYPHWKLTLTHNHYSYMKLFIHDFSFFFVLYDVFILWKLYKSKKN